MNELSIKNVRKMMNRINRRGANRRRSGARKGNVEAKAFGWSRNQKHTKT
jgi:hypothetical protein